MKASNRGGRSAITRFRNYFSYRNEVWLTRGHARKMSKNVDRSTALRVFFQMPLRICNAAHPRHDPNMILKTNHEPWFRFFFVCGCLFWDVREHFPCSPLLFLFPQTCCFLFKFFIENPCPFSPFFPTEADGEKVTLAAWAGAGCCLRNQPAPLFITNTKRNSECNETPYYWECFWISLNWM